MVHPSIPAELLPFVLPAKRLLDIIAYESHQERWRSAHDKHVSPTVAASYEVVGHGSKKKPT